MVLVTRFFVHKHAKETANEITNHTDATLEPQKRHFWSISSSWKRMVTPKQEQTKGRWVPTFSSIIEAGDEGLISSTLFNELQRHPENVSLSALYQVFADELRTRPLKERSAYSLEVGKFLSDSRQSVGSVGRSRSVSQRHTSNMRPESISKVSRKSLDYSAVEKGLSRSFSMKRPSPVLVPMHSGPHGCDGQQTAQGFWYGYGQRSEYHNGNSNMKITAAELVALSIVLGNPIQPNVESDAADIGVVAFGLSLKSMPHSNARQQITFHRHNRTTSQRHAQGSGTSLLYAKHLAVGSLPFSQDGISTSSILVDEATFGAIRAGTPLSIKSTTATTPQSRLLASLPNSRQCEFHILTASAEVNSSLTIIDAISTLPFAGGLVALSSTPLINTIHFIASAGTPPVRLLQRLEGLVDKVNCFSPGLKIFGPLYEPSNARILYREHERLVKLATDPSINDTLADKTARMSRYITLLERLMALVPDLKPQEVLVAVQDATRTEIRQSYSNAVTVYATYNTSRTSDIPTFDCPPASDKSSRRKSAMSRVSNRGSDRKSTVSTPGTSSSSPRSSAELDRNLGKQMERILKMALPLDIKTIAFVARMVIVAWTLSVGHVAWEEGEKGLRLPHLEDQSAEMTFC